MSRYALWTRQSSDAWPQLAEALRIETGLDVCLHQPGGFHLLLSPEEVENRANALKRLHNQPGMVPFEYHILDHAQAEKMLPQIGPDVVGASFCPLDGLAPAAESSRPRSRAPPVGSSAPIEPSGQYWIFGLTPR